MQHQALLKLKVIDEIIQEPLGGAHRDRDVILNNVRQTLTKNLNYFDELSFEEIMNERKNKFLKIGRNDGFMTSTEDLSTLTIKKNNLDQIFKSKKTIRLMQEILQLFGLHKPVYWEA